jgi:hypothetical protein
MTVSTASFTTVDQSVSHFVKNADTYVTITQTDADQQTVTLQREQGSKGSGSWETIKQWVSEAATITYVYRTQGPNETLRMYLTTDGGGTNVVTLTDEPKSYKKIATAAGDTIVDFKDTGINVSGGIRRSSNPVDETGATLTITSELHAGRVVTLNRAAGVACTLPAATGTGDVYTFYIGTLNTSVGNVVKVASSADVIQGGVAIATDIAGVVINTETTTDTLTIGGADTTSGGLVGSWVRVTDVAAGVFMLEGFLISAGAEATPFSAGV